MNNLKDRIQHLLDLHEEKIITRQAANHAQNEFEQFSGDLAAQVREKSGDGTVSFICENYVATLNRRDHTASPTWSFSERAFYAEYEAEDEAEDEPEI